MPDDSQPDFAADIDAIAQIESVPMLLEVICRTSGLGFAAIARVTEDRWVACAVRDEIAFGLSPGGELAVATTLCNEVRARHEPIVIDHVAEDATYCGHPTPRLYGFQSYISVPIFRRSGEFFGTLCAIDPKPARLKSGSTLDTFKLFAQLISLNLETHTRAITHETALQHERGNAELRERFIAVLGHDLRNPLGAIVAAATVLARGAADATSSKMIASIRRSSARIGELVDNLLDLARGRLGGGMRATRTSTGELRERLDQIVYELQLASPQHEIVSEIALEHPVTCESRRIEQLLSNLISNAIKHGEKNGVVRVVARTDSKEFVLSVANSGQPIPESRLAALFEPFQRDEEAEAAGLGLGLYICSEIARAHHGTLSVTSDESETRFTFRMPVAGL